MLGELKRKQIGEGAFMNSVIEPKFKSDRISLCLVTPLKKEKDIFIMVTAMGPSSVDIVCKVYVKWDSYETLRCRLNEKIKLAFDENKIEIPYNQIDVHMK